MISMLHCMPWRQHIALDVGTASIRIAAGLSPLTEHPSLVGVKRALRDGVIVDGEAVSHILEPPLDRLRRFGILKPCVLACAPSDARQEERQVLIDSIINAGAASVMIIPEPLAAAIGSGLDVSSPYAQMIIDIGEGVTDCAIIRSSKIRTTCAIRIGCDQMRSAIVATAISYGCTINDSYADTLMRTSGLMRPTDHVGSVLAKTALQPVIGKIADTIVSFLLDLPNHLGCEVIESGICLTGGGSLIPGVREYFEQRTGIGITIASNPRASVAEGARLIVPIIMQLNLWR